MHDHLQATGRPVAGLPISDPAGLTRALDEANLPTLLMVYVTLTQDADYLERFAPHLRSVYSGQPMEPPAELAADLKRRLFDLLTSPTPPVERPLPPELMRRMMSVSVGEEVAEEFVPIVYEQMGFERDAPAKIRVGAKRRPQDFKVLVIGAGMTGLAAGIKLGQAGFDFQLVEKNPEVGGTWWENRYPGVGVDTPSHFYSYSFELNPDWSHYCPKGPEVQAYLSGVADKYRLRDKILFETRVIACVFDEAVSLWRVTVADKDGAERVLEANAVINAHGVLNRWSMPKIPGLKTFKGPAMHTAGWDSSVDLTGKRVALIGTGASGAQVAPAIAAKVKQLVVFQRSKHWVIMNPEVNTPVTDGVRFALRHIPRYQEWFRFRVYWFTGDGLYGNVLRDPSWPNQEISVSAQNDAARQYSLSYMQAKFADRPDLVEKMTPDYPIFGKRIVLDSEGGWLDTLKRDNVVLETGHIDHIEPDAVVLKDGTRYEVDALVLATGFDLARMLGSLKVVGRGGRELGAEWGEDDPRAYLGVMVPGYPNFFLTIGPNSAPNHAAGVNMIVEAQVKYITECLNLLIAKDADTLEPTEAACQAWNAKVDDQMKQMIWTHPKAKSYYLNSKGRNFVSCPFKLADYWAWTRRPDEEAVVLS